MNKTLSFLFLALILTLSVQLLGVEQAFCDDSAAETECHDCMTCAFTPFTGLNEPLLAPPLSLFASEVISPLMFEIEEPIFRFFRPPIFS